MPNPELDRPIESVQTTDPYAAKVRANWAQFHRTRPSLIWVPATLAAGITGFALLTSAMFPIVPQWLALAGPIAGLVMYLATRRSYQSWLAEGRLCAAMVVNQDLGRVAVLVDLAKPSLNDPHALTLPAVKIENVPLNRLTDPPGVDARLSAVCSFRTSLTSNDHQAFDRVSALIVEVATSSQATQQRCLETIPANHWQVLADAIDGMRQFRPGTLHQLTAKVG